MVEREQTEVSLFGYSQCFAKLRSETAAVLAIEYDACQSDRGLVLVACQSFEASEMMDSIAEEHIAGCAFNV